MTGRALLLSLIAGALTALPLRAGPMQSRPPLGEAIREVLIETPALLAPVLAPEEPAIDLYADEVARDLDLLAREAPRLFARGLPGFGPEEAAPVIAFFTASECPDCAQAEAELRASLTGLHECFPWMLDGPMPLPPDGPVLQAAAAYEALARIAELGGEVAGEDQDAPPPTELLYLMAEAQSSILVAVRSLGLRGDSDQRDLFAWLKH